jgi:hypothetical protein
MGLDKSPPVKASTTTKYRHAPGRLAYQPYASKVSIQKKPLSTSFRSATQATDSTRRGCTANRAAAIALRQTAPVSSRSARKSSTPLTACNATLLRWNPNGRRPNRLASASSDSHVSGCQFPVCRFVNAQTSPDCRSPRMTCWFSAT